MKGLAVLTNVFEKESIVGPPPRPNRPVERVFWSLVSKVTDSWTTNYRRLRRLFRCLCSEGPALDSSGSSSSC